jgi:hypothetical protein
MDLGDPGWINGNRPMPELAVEPLKCKGVVQIIITELVDVAGQMKRFTGPGIKTYVKVNFQNFV